MSSSQIEFSVVLGNGKTGATWRRGEQELGEVNDRIHQTYLHLQ